ncbi:MAG: type II secretion system F family protein [Streptosporangiales bacterium]
MNGVGVPGLVSAGLAAVAVWLWSGQAHAVRSRLRALYRDDPRPADKGSTAGAVRGRVPASLGAGTAAALLVGLPWGLLLGAAVALGSTIVLGRIEPAEVRKRRERLAADLPIAVDLLGACLRAGSTPVDAADAVARAVGGPLGAALDGVVALLRLGGDPATAWASLGNDQELAPLGRAFGRAASTGAPLAAGLEQLAADGREARRTQADEGARKVGVKSAAPLGLCFLPAFVLLGVVPVVAGVAQNINLWW